jgi:hypothetical protein
MSAFMIGTVWSDNYYDGTTHKRYVKVLAVNGARTEIQACEADGAPLKKGRAPRTTTRSERFRNSGRAGFTFVCQAGAKEEVVSDAAFLRELARLMTSNGVPGIDCGRIEEIAAKLDRFEMKPETSNDNDTPGVPELCAMLRSLCMADLNQALTTEMFAQAAGLVRRFERATGVNPATKNRP